MDAGEATAKARTQTRDRSTSSTPHITLPKPGGAIRSIDDKLAVNPATGTVSLSIPIPITAGRSGFAPSLTLGYDSGAGNGPFGLGWSLGVPAIARKTTKGLPRYWDGGDAADETDSSDTFVLSGHDDLVPVAIATSRSDGGDDYTVRRYRPRVESAFARIERWRSRATGDIHWRSITKDNIHHIYGRSPDARVADPEDARRVFEWRLEESRDGKGNVIRYLYKAEDRAGVTAAASETNRVATTNRYLKRVLYGNRAPNQPALADPIDPAAWLFEIVLDYGEHGDVPTPDEVTGWRARRDPFSSSRAGFEIRTYRLCTRILAFHRFDELGPDATLVRATELTYDETTRVTQPRSVVQAGFLRSGAGYSREALPPLAFDYTQASLSTELGHLDLDRRDQLVGGVDGSRYRWIDLDGEGLPGVLAERGPAWFYQRNLGGRLEPALRLDRMPGSASLVDGRHQLVDLAGDGHRYLVRYGTPAPGFMRREDAGWGPFHTFASLPTLDQRAPSTRLVDLDGDGLVDLLVEGDDAFFYYPSRGTAGFGSPETVPRALDEARGPRLLSNDPVQTMFLADMTGDGLVDLVRIRDGEVSYWPNRGYGNFGRRVVMDRPPQFDTPDRFEPRRIQLVDIDGTGTTDLVYVSADGRIRYWINEAGNGWSSPHALAAAPLVDRLTSLTALDLLGTGTACLVFSRPLPRGAGDALSYIDLMGRKPYLLARFTNGLGAETSFEYAASTRAYVADRAAGRPWVTKLPFPVQVVIRIETHDAITGNRFVRRNTYHHGFYDGTEREFRGFGMVEELDAETFDADSELHLPPALTRTWFHTGAFFDADRISRQYEHEYTRGPDEAPLDDSRVSDGLSPADVVEACRALKGQIVRREVFVLDGSADEPSPYTVSERSYDVRLLHAAPATGPTIPRKESPHASFMVHPRETIEVHYERRRDDPRVTHALTLSVDAFGQITQAAAVAYPRHVPAIEEQGLVLVTFEDEVFANRPDELDWYRVGVPTESRKLELTGIGAPDGPGRYRLDTIRNAVASATQIAYEAEPGGGLEKRCFDHTRRLYYRDDLAGSLPANEIESLGLVYEEYKLALTPGLVAEIYGTRVAAADLTGSAGYVQTEAGFWISSGRQVFDPQQFYLPIELHDPFGGVFTTRYDAHALVAIEVVDPVGNRSGAEIHYRVVQPWQLRDANDNRTGVRFDALGRVVATAVMGKPGTVDGDTLDPSTLDPSRADDPTTRVEYRPFEWLDRGKPGHVRVLARERHGATNPRWQESYSYSDGTGREVMKKTQAAPGDAPRRNTTGALVLDAQHHVVMATIETRWVGTGRVVVDNKGNPVRQYEPFFSSTFEYEDERELVEWGVTPIHRYDPLGRRIRTDRPDGTFTTTAFDAWQQTISDENDSVLASRWYAERTAAGAAAADARAAAQAARHASTPTVVHVDPLARAVVTIADRGDTAGSADGVRLLRTHVALDIEGNQRAVTDARQTVVEISRFDLAGRRISVDGPDAGLHVTLLDATDMPIHAWDGRGIEVRTAYDALRRPTRITVRAADGTERLAELLVYGESHPGAAALDLRARLHRHYDGAGLSTNEAYDVDGNLVRASRQLARDYRGEVDWSVLGATTDVAALSARAAPLLADHFETTTNYDALRRVVHRTTPDGSIATLAYNAASQIERVDVALRGATTATAFVTDIAYNAKGQRETIAYGNGTRCTYDYDPTTFRLVRLHTVRASDGSALQDLGYTYDPVGNIVEIRDDAQATLYYAQSAAAAMASYEYDAVYWLTLATGRERVTAAGPVDGSDIPAVALPHPNDGQAARTYTEDYEYDAAGNLALVTHTPAGGTRWTRDYAYAAASNRLASTSISRAARGAYAYDACGNMQAMPHLARLDWDHKNRLRVVDLGGGGTAYYTYDGAGQRVRKVVERSAALTEERVYVDGWELYRRHRGGVVDRAIETVHVMDDKRRIALVETETTTGGAPLVRYQLDNHLGSATLELGAASEILSYEEYLPYGETAFRATRSDVELEPKRYRYTGKERDDETGCHYVSARYYAAWLGRWTSCDPIGIAGGLNQYRFAANNPVNFKDPTGTEPAPAQTAIDPAIVDELRGFVASTHAPEFRGADKSAINRVSDDLLGEARTRSGAHDDPPPGETKASSTGQRLPTPKKAENSTKLTGVYLFGGSAPNRTLGAATLSTEALGLVGYDRNKGLFFGTLFGVGGGLHTNLTFATEVLYFPRTREIETENLVLAETHLFDYRAVGVGIGGFVSRKDPSEIGIFIPFTSANAKSRFGPAVGIGATLKLSKSPEEDARLTLGALGIELRRTSEPVAPLTDTSSLSFKFEYWKQSLRKLFSQELSRDRFKDR